MTFSSRTRFGLPAEQAEEKEELSRLERARQSRLQAQAPLLDLTVSNPTTAGIAYDERAVLAAFASSTSSLRYEPKPLGLDATRETVAQLANVDPARVAITASTSEAYAMLFKMLCDPGDQILVPSPSYPLLSWLASFESVELVSYPLLYAGGEWHVDLGALKRAVTPRTKGIVVVHPNNPTGSYLRRSELEAMLDLDLPILSDEVFAEYPLGTTRVPSLATLAEKSLVFSLSGLSKLAGLPQMKLGWIVCGGDPRRIHEAMARLENILDAYLSVGTPVQHALPDLLSVGEKVREQIRARTRSNLAKVDQLVRHDLGVSRLGVEAGWYVTLRIPETSTDEDWAITLVREDGVYVHPGYFFDMESGAHLILSLLTPERDLEEGLTRILGRIERCSA